MDVSVTLVEIYMSNLFNGEDILSTKFLIICLLNDIVANWIE